MKDVILLILEAVLFDFKRRCEQNSDEKSADIYGKWHGQIKTMINTIQNGGVK
jgi:hypothetical protein